MKRLAVLGQAALAVCLAVQTFAQTPQRVALHAAHVLDVKSGKMLADQTLVIENGRIISSGPSAGASIPAEAARIDLPNATVLHGLIDAYTHLTMDPKFGYETLALSVPRQTLTGAKNARLTLLAGFMPAMSPDRACWSAARLLELLADTATKTCWPTNFTRLAMALPTALRRCNTKSATTSSTVPTLSRYAPRGEYFRSETIRSTRSTRLRK
jgi:hypothetical protein